MNPLILLALLALPGAPVSPVLNAAQPSYVDDTQVPAKETSEVTLDVTGMT